jgi:aspartate/methionine/tyrosine aminotransferase
MTGRVVAARAARARRSTIRAIFDAAQGRPDLIRLEIGEPSFTTPEHIIEGARAAALAGYTGYGPNGGLLSLRELLVGKLEAVDGIVSEPDEIVVTPGGMNALFTTFLTLLEPGDEVLLPSPGFPNMDEMIRLLGGSPVFYPLEPGSGYLPDPALIASLITPRTTTLFVNSPSNPTGTVIPGPLMEQLVELARARDLWFVSDEVYDQLILDDGVPHVAARRFDTDGRVITIHSFSKVYAMTGWRVGYAVADRKVADVMRKLQEPQTSCPSTISQKGAEAALLGPRAPIDEMRDAYRTRRDAAWEAIGRAGLRGPRSVGTIYQLIDISDAGIPSLEFSLRLLDEFGVAVAPGSVFGPRGEGMVRISFAAPNDAIVEGVVRIGHAVQAWAK